MVGRKFFESLDESLKVLPIDLNAIVKHCNWDLQFENLYGEDGFTMMRYKNGKKKFCICLDPGNMVQRKRFTLAHEIGHIVLGHFEKYYAQTLSSYEEFVSDKEADMVAGEIIMPYINMLEHYRWSIKGLTYRYHVSYEAAQVRKDVLRKDFMFLRDINSKSSNNADFRNYLNFSDFY